LFEEAIFLDPRRPIAEYLRAFSYGDARFRRDYRCQLGIGGKQGLLDGVLQSESAIVRFGNAFPILGPAFRYKHFDPPYGHTILEDFPDCLRASDQFVRVLAGPGPGAFRSGPLLKAG